MACFDLIGNMVIECGHASFLQVIIDIGLLNILIAQLALAYESLTKETTGFSRMNRAYTIGGWHIPQHKNREEFRLCPRALSGCRCGL